MTLVKLIDFAGGVKKNLSRVAIASSAIAVSTLTIVPVQAATVSSTFDTDAEGWTTVYYQNSASNNPPSTPANLTYFATGGNPGGYIAASDFSANDLTFIAPSKFLGDKSTFLNGSLSFDLTTSFIIPGGYGAFLRGAGLTLASFISTPNPNQWETYSLALSNTNQNVWFNILPDNSTFVPATNAEIQVVLANLTSLEFNGDFQFGTDTTTIDNVFLVSPSSPPVSSVPEPSSSLGLLSLGVLGIGAALKRKL